MIDPINAKEFERPFNSHARLNDQADKSSVNNQVSGPTNAKHTHTHTHTLFKCLSHHWKPFVLFMIQEQKHNKLVIDLIDAKEIERPFNSDTRLNDQAEKSSVNNQASASDSPRVDSGPNHFDSTSSEDSS